MGEPHVVSALREKRAEISGAILELEKRMAQHRGTPPVSAALAK